MMWAKLFALYCCHRKPPMPGFPMSISTATMTSHAIPRDRRKPVNMYGRAEGIRTLNKVFMRESFSTLATLR